MRDRTRARSHTHPGKRADALRSRNLVCDIEFGPTRGGQAFTPSRASSSTRPLHSGLGAEREGGSVAVTAAVGERPTSSLRVGQVQVRLLDRLPLERGGVRIDIAGLAPDDRITVLSIDAGTGTRAHARAIYQHQLQQAGDPADAYVLEWAR